MVRRFFQDEKGDTIGTIIMLIALAIIAIAVVIAVGGPVGTMRDNFVEAWTSFWAGIMDRFGGGWGQ